MVFFDTNIFIYVVSSSPEDAARRQVAQGLLFEHRFGLSVQVLQEFMDATLRKKHLQLTPEEVSEMVSLLIAYPVAETTIALARAAFEIKVRHGISYWDAAIVAAALELGCHTLYSEDLNHGQDYDGVRVINPFL